MAQASTIAFFVLCALVGAIYASPLGPAASFCVDLTTGKTSVLPDNTGDVIWTSKPTSDGGRCNLRGVLKITPPKWAQSVSYHMAFERPTRYSFNIGDSRTNNAWGGDSSTTHYDAEIHSYNSGMYVFENDYAGSDILAASASVKSAMLIRLSNLQMYATNYEGYNYYNAHKGLFAFDTMYMGLNRVVDSSRWSSRRIGRGLCSVCIYFLEESTASLHDPRRPISTDDATAAVADMPAPDDTGAADETATADDTAAVAADMAPSRTEPM